MRHDRHRRYTIGWLGHRERSTAARRSTGQIATKSCLRSVLQRMHDLLYRRQLRSNMEGLSVRVGGPSVIFPRGYLWLAPIWFAAAAAELGLGLKQFPLWVRADLAGGLFMSLIIFIAVVSSLTFRAFAVDRAGVRLGLPAYSRRRGRKRRAARHLPWEQIERVRIARRPYGVRLEIILGPNATLAARGGQAHPGLIVMHRILLLIPFWYLVRPTGLTTPLDGPPRYRVALRGVTVEEMRRSLRILAPPEVAIAVLVRRGQSVSSARAIGQRA
jgi:hypothetical protein